MTTAINEKIVGNLPVPETGNKVHYFSGATLQGKKAPAGFGVRITAGETRSFVWFHRVNGKKHLETIGTWRGSPGGGTLSVLEAINDCIDRTKEIASGVDKEGNKVDARPERTRRVENGGKEAGLTVAGLLDKFVDRYVEKEAKLRSADTIKDAFERLVKPAIGKLGIYDIRRSHVVEMLDEIADDSGPVMADRTLAYVRKAFNWYATRDDEFTPPIVKGMARSKGKERARKRVLGDVELRDLWTALDKVKEPACYPFYVKTLLLTATRRTEAARMNATELDGGVWTIPADRYKTKMAHVIPLSTTARELIGGAPAPKVKKNFYFIFSTTEGEVPFSGYSKAKTALDKAIADIRQAEGREPMPDWTLHDLRRTARSLMSRAKVPTDHAERAIGHVIGGVRETYDRYEYLDEKCAAFEALAAMVSNILNPESNVITLRKA